MAAKVINLKVERYVRRGIMIPPELELAITTHNIKTAQAHRGTITK